MVDVMSDVECLGCKHIDHRPTSHLCISLSSTTSPRTISLTFFLWPHRRILLTQAQMAKSIICFINRWVRSFVDKETLPLLYLCIYGAVLNKQEHFAHSENVFRKWDSWCICCCIWAMQPELWCAALAVTLLCMRR